MTYKPLSILVALAFLLDVVAWHGAHVWTFGNFRISYLIPLALATALAVSQLRGHPTSFWLIGLVSGVGTYASFRLFLYMDAKDMAGGAYIAPGVLFSLCLALLAITLRAARIQKEPTQE